MRRLWEMSRFTVRLSLSRGSHRAKVTPDLICNCSSLTSSCTWGHRARYLDSRYALVVMNSSNAYLFGEFFGENVWKRLPCLYSLPLPYKPTVYPTPQKFAENYSRPGFAELWKSQEYCQYLCKNALWCVVWNIYKNDHCASVLEVWSVDVPLLIHLNTNLN